MAAHYGEVGRSRGLHIPGNYQFLAQKMAPWGAKDALFGTNPLAHPRRRAPQRRSSWIWRPARPALGRIIMAAAGRQGDSPRNGLLIARGQSTTDATAALGGTVEYRWPARKDLVLAFHVWMFSAACVDRRRVRNWACDRSIAIFRSPKQCAHLMIVIDVGALVPVEKFRASMRRYVRDFKACQPAQGRRSGLFAGRN